MARILVIDDDPNLREVLAFALREEGHEAETRGDGEAGLERLASWRADLVITDLKMPGMGGLEVLRRVLELDPEIPVVLLTAFGSIEEAVEAMKLGAYHYLTKPYSRDELRLTVNQALERRRLVRENRDLRDRLREKTRQIEFVHAAEAMDRVLALVRRIAPTQATILITGESGTGKEVVAQAIHAYSDRWDRPFVPVDCGAIPRDLMESELFGHTRGAFTGAVKDKPGMFRRADGGTLFLDEIGNLPPDLQGKLLRAIETGQVAVVGGTQPVQVDVRFIAATNVDLAASVQEGRFRSDLYYRLNVIPIHVPPLRERPEDIPALWEHFVRKFAREAPVRSSPELVRALLRRRWTGNVRELANVCQRMVLLRASDILREADLPLEGAVMPLEGAVMPLEGAVMPLEGAAAPADALFPGELPPGHLPLMDLEREIIRRALARHGGNRTRAAEYLGIPRHVLLYRLEKYRLE